MSSLFFYNGFDFHRLNDVVWGWPLIVTLISVGIIYSFRTKFLQIFHLKDAFLYMFKKEESAKGEISPFASLCTCLSATVGTGNIVGVASAVCTGGPGALFWMLIASFFGMATKYAEGFLAIKYRQTEKDGSLSGGPFYYIEKGLGRKFKPLAILFAAFGTLTGILGIGTMTQSNSITSAVSSFYGESRSLTVILSIVITGFAAVIILGGIKRISAVSTFIVPIMSVMYIVLSLITVIRNIDALPYAMKLIYKTAFSPDACLGAATGITLKTVIQKGVGRGIFSNEAGLGSAPIAAASAKTDDPVQQGLICMLSVFIDTVLICSLTGLSVIVTGAYSVTGLEGIQITDLAWQKGLPFNADISSFLMMSCISLFAFTTVIGWNFYSERCLLYLFKDSKHRHKVILIFRILYIISVFIGCYLSVDTVWTLADIFNGLMAFPNLVALFLLCKTVTQETLNYFNTKRIIMTTG